MRLILTTSMLMAAMAFGGMARADDAAAFEAVSEWPAAQVMCLGEAQLPDMLRFAFQPEPRESARPQIIRVSSGRRSARAAPARRQAAPRQVMQQAGPPLLRLPCIRG